MVLNLKDEKSGRVVGNEWPLLASDLGFCGGTCELNDVEADEEPFMNCSLLPVIYSTNFVVGIGRGKNSACTLRLLGGCHTASLRESWDKGKKTRDAVKYQARRVTANADCNNCRAEGPAKP